MAEFEVWNVSAWEAVNPEPIGRDAKLWVREPGAPSLSRERDWLFKPVIVTASGHRQGEDWTEKIVSELGGLLGVPCAEIELAVRRGVPGSISRNVAPDGWNLVLGSVRLTVEHVNGPEVPAHLRLLVLLDGHAPVDYQPMSGPRWQTY